MVKIGLDAGHGLNTAGKQTPDCIKEWTLNDKVRDKVVYKLKDYDVEFVHTDNDEGNVDESLTSRVAKYVNAGVAALVSIHHNAFTGTWNSATGVEVFVDPNATEDDLKLAECIYKRLVEYTGLRGRGIKRADFTIINQNGIPAVLCEGGFMDGSEDYKIITSEAGQDAYARAVSEGLIEFLNLQKKSEPVKPAAPAPTPVVTPSNNASFVEANDIVAVKDYAVYYGGNVVPDWVKKKHWIVSEVEGNRAVIDKSTDGKNSIKSAIDVKFLTVISSSTGNAQTPTLSKDEIPYLVRVDIDDLNIRKGPGTNYNTNGQTGKGVFTIVAESAGKGSDKGWGKLKSGAGWISLDFATKI